MLAQSFKTAAELNLSVKGYEALKKALVELELEHVSFAKRISPRSTSSILFSKYETVQSRYGFNMHTWGRSGDTDCGTVCCIGGLAEQLGEADLFIRERYMRLGANEGLLELFHPGSMTHKKYDWDLITPDIAARCLRGYLETGVADWDAALA